MSDSFQVYAKPASPGLSFRKLFEGLEDDARFFVEDNFPRVHVEPGSDYGDQEPSTDAVLVHPGGNVSAGDGVEYFYGADAGWSDATPVKKSRTSKTEPVE